MTIGRLMAAALFLVGFSVPPAFAEAKAGPVGGVEVGLNMSTVSPAVAGEVVTRGPGLVAGGWVLFQPWGALGIQLEATYSQKNTHLSSQTDLKLNYIEVPIVAKLKLIKKIYLVEGIAFGFPLSAKVVASSSGTVVLDIKDTVTSPDIGMVIGGGVPVSPKASIEFRYTGGFKVIEGGDQQRSRTLAGIVRIKL